MIQIINNIATDVGMVYYLRQLLTIMIIFIWGFLVVISLMSPCDNVADFGKVLRKSTVCAFPAGIAMVILCGYIMLVFGIPYNGALMCILVVLAGMVPLYVGIRKEVFRIFVCRRRCVFFIALAVIVLAAVACSGVIRMSVSNDSLYYFWQYPRAIVYYGGLRDQFDNFLTDTGLGASVIGTIPFLFGFGESFGIQEFFHISFLAFFGNYLYENCVTVLGRNNRKAVVVALLGTIILALCTPSLILSHWAMSNMYFMELYFICLVLALDSDWDNRHGTPIVYSLILFAVSVIRVEGGIFVLFLILAASIRNVPGKKLVSCMLPVVILQSLYEIKIFTVFTIDHPYTFLTIEKSILQLCAYVAVIGYLLLIRDRIKDRFSGKIAPFILLGLVVVNLVLLAYDSSHYMANINAFVGNLTGQSGWGILPHISIGVLLIIICLEIFDNRFTFNRFVELTNAENNVVAYWIFNTIGFFLITLAVSFARGDDLNIDTGDSGNRVLLQIAPIIIVMFVLWIVDNLQRTEKDV